MSERRRALAVGVRLMVDPVACDGVGMCAHLAADVVRLDTWGYPIIQLEPLSERQERQAGRAVEGCPRKALRIEEI